MAEIVSSYPRIETRSSVTPDKEKLIIQKFNIRIITKFKNRAFGILGFGYYSTKNLIFRHLPVDEYVILYEKRDKNLMGYEMEIKLVLTNVDNDEIVQMAGKNVLFTREMYTEKTL